MSRTPQFLICILLLVIMTACAQPTLKSAQPIPEPGSTAFPQVTLPGTEVRVLKSSSTGRDYDIYVRIPEGYGESTKKYPVLYLLDGQWDFKMLDSIYGGLFYDNFVPEMLIVGITYSGINPDYNALRAMDYTPKGDIPGSGDAPKFLAFFKQELIPFVEANYRTNPAQRYLMGSSFGGLFTLYAMFTEPSLFRGYVVGSPALPYGDGALIKQEADYFSQHKDLPVRLFLSVGDAETLKYPVMEFMKTMTERNYTGLELKTMVIADEGHASNKPEAYNRGLRFVFIGK
jgi:predicted alpha/beta superfamily hydrolase